VLNLFYQVFDRGFMRDGEGRVIDFRNTVIVMTSNLGSEEIMAATDAPKEAPVGNAVIEPGGEVTTGMLMETIRPLLVEHFQPALLARFQTVVYRPLSADALASIVRMKLARVAARIERRFRQPLVFDEALVAALARACRLPDSGARNIDSLLDRGQNFYVHVQPATGKFIFVPWDQDFSFGNRAGVNTAQAWTIYHPWMGQNAFLGRMYALEAFRTAYLGKLQEFTKTIFRAERFAEQTALIGPAIRPAVQQEGQQWVAFMDQVTSGQAGIVPFARARNESVIAQLASGGGGRSPR